MEFALKGDEKELWHFYREVIDTVNGTSVRLGWDINVYPDDEFIQRAIADREMCIIRDNGKIVAAAVVNHNVNAEYNDVNWDVKGPANRIATIHALAVAPDRCGSKVSYKMLQDIEAFCIENGDLAIHLDVIDTNIPAYKLYTRNGYCEKAIIKMFYESVGTRTFWMMEKCLS